MSARIKPNGMASGNATSTMASAMRKPWNTEGMLETRMGGLRNRRRNVFSFHFWTHGCSLSQLDAESQKLVPVTVMAGTSGMSCAEPSASV